MSFRSGGTTDDLKFIRLVAVRRHAALTLEYRRMSIGCRDTRTLNAIRRRMQHVHSVIVSLNARIKHAGKYL